MHNAAAKGERAAAPADGRPGRFALAALAGISAIYFFAYFHRVAIPGSIFDELQTAFQAPASAITALGMLFLYVYGGMQIVAGLLTDRLGAARILLWGGSLLTLGALCFPLAPTLPLLYTARILLAFGASLVFAGLVKGVASLFGGRHFPVYLGIALSVGYAGGLAGTLPFAQAAAHWGWRPALLGVGILGLLALLAAAGIITRPSPLREAAASHPGLRTIAMVLRNPRAWPVMVVGALNFSVYFLFQATLGKKLLLDYYRIPAATAATFTFAMMLVTIACLLLSGLWSRALGNRRRPIMHMAVACMLAGAALLCGCLRFGLDYRWVLVSYCLLGMTSLSSPLHSTLLKEYNPPDAVGTAVGLSNAGCYLAVALVTGVAGWIMDRFAVYAAITDTAIRYPREAYLLIAGLCLLLLTGSGIATLFVSETHGRQQSAESPSSKDQGHAGLITS